MLGTCQVYSGQQRFLKILTFARNVTFFLKPCIFIIGNKWCHLFSLRWWATFIHFQDSICQIPKSEVPYVVSHSLQLKWWSMGWGPVLCGREWVSVPCGGEWASVCFPFGPTCTQGSRCHESIIMLLHQECSSVKWFFSFLWRTQWPFEHLVPVSWFLLRLQQFYHCCFYIVSANVNSGKGK